VTSGRQATGHHRHLDEDALAGTRLGGVHHRLIVALRHEGQAPRPTRIVQRPPGFGHVGDSILELHEDVGAMVETQAVTRAQVLIDPHPHRDDANPRVGRLGEVEAVSSGTPTLSGVVPSASSSAPPPDGAEPTAPRKPQEIVRPTGVVNDDWFWLRDRNDPDTITYLNAENAHCDQWFAERADLVERIFGEIKSRIQETDQSVPTHKGEWWYSSRTEEGSQYAIHCRGASRDSATANLLLDENEEADGHEYFALGTFDVSPAGDRLAWSFDIDGGEHYTLRIRDLTTGQDLDDEITDVSWAGTAWSADGRHIFYVTYDDQERPSTVWRHQIGTSASADVRVFHEDDERFHVGIDLTRSDRWIIIDCDSKTSSETWLISADEATAEPRCVRTRSEDLEYHLDHWGDRFVILTNENAVDFAVMIAPEDDPGRWSTFIPHEEGNRITRVDPFSGHLVVHEWNRAQPRLRIVRRDGSSEVLELGDEPHDVEIDSNPEWNTNWLRYSTASLTSPTSVWEHDVTSGERNLLKRVPTPNVDLASYRSARHWAPAPDGTLVPYDIAHHVDTPLDGTAPCLVYGYGSYEASMPPWFSVARLSALDRGWVWVLAHPRGGGEMGRRWYLDGKLLAKRNTFDDTNAVADHLVAGRVASPDRLAVRGGSAGGLLVGACITMRPDRWAAAVAEVPFVDVVNTMSDPTLPLTVTEWEEWGDPRTEPYASYMLSYCPYDNTDARDYPALYVTGGLNDPRVAFHEPAKWVARIRHLRTNGAPLLLRMEMGAGHGGASGRYDQWRDEARVYAFLFSVLG